MDIYMYKVNIIKSQYLIVIIWILLSGALALSRQKGTLKQAVDKCHNQNGLLKLTKQAIELLLPSSKDHGQATVWLPFKRLALKKWMWVNGMPYRHSMRAGPHHQFCARAVLEENILENVECSSSHVGAMCNGEGIPDDMGIPVKLSSSSSVVLLDGKYSWHDARDLCRQLGSDLAVLPLNISSAVEDELKYLERTFKNMSGVYWVGLSKVRWVHLSEDFKAAAGIKWCDGEPDDGNSTVVWNVMKQCAQAVPPTSQHRIVCESGIRAEAQKTVSAGTGNEAVTQPYPWGPINFVFIMLVLVISVASFVQVRRKISKLS